MLLILFIKKNKKKNITYKFLNLERIGKLVNSGLNEL